MNKFKKGDIVTHKNGDDYIIIKEPSDIIMEINEANWRPFYEYKQIGHNNNYARCVTKMEDGRFVLKNTNTSTDKTKQQISVMQAYVDGKNIEIKAVGGMGYYDCPGSDAPPIWNWTAFNYRVKVEKLVWIKNEGTRPDCEIYICRFSDGLIMSNEFRPNIYFNFSLSDSKPIIEYMIIE